MKYLNKNDLLWGFFYSPKGIPMPNYIEKG